MKNQWTKHANVISVVQTIRTADKGNNLTSKCEIFKIINTEMLYTIYCVISIYTHKKVLDINFEDYR